MVVDDSAVVRGLITRMLESDPGIRVVSSVGNGELAVRSLAREDVDVIVLDIEMPVMDGLTALPKLLEVDPGIKIIMASTLTVRNAEVSLQALQAGAADYIPKPSTSRELTGGMDFRHELLQKVRTLGAQRARRSGRRPGVARRPMPRMVQPIGGAPRTVTLRKAATLPPQVLAVGSSTGGPQALLTLFKGLKPTLGLPIVVTQHMPATFTAVLAEHLTRATVWQCAEAKDGEALAPGKVLIAPGDYHMIIEARGAQKIARLTQAPPENFCRPSVDPMLRSLAEAYGGRVLVTILTGMGNDGLNGGRAVIEAGGTVVAQDEASSVVWGMPGAVATAGLCSAVLPLDQVASHIMRVAGKG